ncbi:ABC transporter permease subunit [Billgrantia sp. LNSP4103-1]|uniref:ABC transporter permease subunit n=1 Tax=Billgrantia sp. LNSP4103-1 TaxID=3410266 RepID=UPI00403F6DC1
MIEPSRLSSPFRSPWRRRLDRLATGLIAAGGIGVILAVMAIGAFLAVEVMPALFEGVLAWERIHASLSPMAWGTLKAAVWGMVFAVPLALGAAIHSAMFMSQRLRGRMKPTLEMMEAMPGVVVGFFAGLVLAPWVDRHLTGFLMLLLVLPLAVLLAAGIWRRLRSGWRRHLSLARAGLWLVPWLLLVSLATFSLSPGFEALLFDGDLRTWLDRELGLDYASRNAILVGLAMGFAVMPSVFALAEDALSGVPGRLGEGAHALGATRWQTLWRVVLPAASPGIFAAVMIGTGRAVGETMIVLMASGNTALMSLNPFEGMRTMAAGIAVGLPEAVPGSEDYLLLMLAALLLFVFTFLVNTLAEVVRSRLKRRYRWLGGAA